MPEQGHSLVARDTAQAEGLNIQALADRGRPAIPRLDPVAVERAAITSPPREPIGHRPETAGELGLDPEHMKWVLPH